MKTDQSKISAMNKENLKPFNAAKKLLLGLLIINGVAYADCNDPANAQKVVNKLHHYNKNAVQVDYTKDKIDCANTCKNNIASLDKSINVIMNQVAGTDKCKFTKPTKS